MAKAAAFLTLEIFEKDLDPPLWNSVWQMLFVGDLFLSRWLSPLHQKFVSAPLQTRHPRGGGSPPPPPPPR